MDNSSDIMQGISLYLKKYNSDFSNFIIFYDYLIATNEEFVISIINQLSKEQEKIIINKGVFSIKINEKYLIINQEILEKEYSKFYNIFISFNSIYNKDPTIIENDINLIHLFSFFNSILLFTTQNQTLHNIKRKILLQIKHNPKLASNFFSDNNLIKSEYLLCTIFNNKIRDNCITWHYRYFILSNFHQLLNPNEIDKENKDKANLSKICNILSIPYSNKISLIKCEIDNLNNINISSKRNYHLWTYLINLFNSPFVLKEEQNLIFVFACYLFSKSFSDYSAFSFIVNFYSKIDLQRSSLERLIAYYQQLYQVLNSNNSKSYINNLNSIFFSKK